MTAIIETHCLRGNWISRRQLISNYEQVNVITHLKIYISLMGNQTNQNQTDILKFNCYV